MWPQSRCAQSVFANPSKKKWMVCMGYIWGGLDSSHRMQTNMSVIRGIMRALVYKLYIRKRYYISPICKLKNFEVKVDVQ